MISRRGFLIGAGAAGAAAVTASFRPWTLAASSVTSARSGPLVIVSLYGGNDGINTVIPVADSAYHAARPTLGYSAGEVLELSDGLALNSQLKGLEGLWKAGHLAIVRGVGYPNPNLSHFASMDIWQTANPVDGTGPGWLGRWLDLTGSDPLRAVSVGATLPPMLRGAKQSATAVTSTEITLPALVEPALDALCAAGSDRTGVLADVAQSGADLVQVRSQLDALHAGQTGASTDLSGQLGIVAALINAGAPTQVYQVSLSSFDTHADEKASHERLLSTLDRAVSGFFQAVHAPAILMTFSEFGRRPAENASGGTDHGTAAPLFVAGHTVKGGFYGEEPSLTSLDANGNLVHTVDFRSVYATVLEHVLGVDPVSVLAGRFTPLPFI